MTGAASPASSPFEDCLSFPARFSDGRTAATANAQVSLLPGGLSITAPGHEMPIIWSYGRLRTAQPLTRKSTDVLVVLADQEGPTLFVSGPAFVTALAGHAPHLSAGALRWSHARPWVTLAATLAGVAGLFWLVDFSPARTAARMLPDSARQMLGKQVVSQMVGNRRICTSAEGRAALDKMAARLQTALPGRPTFKIVVADWNLVNAFAAPGSQIVMTRGLIAKAESADEVAGVLAHEMGHGLELHPETGIVRAIGLSAVADLVMGGGGTMTNVGLMLAQLSYSRGAEREADKIALRTMKEAGISVSGLKEFLTRAEKLDGKSDNGALNILSTHPAVAERIAEIERQAPYPATAALSAEEWSQLRSICGAPAAATGDGSAGADKRPAAPDQKKKTPTRQPEPQIRL